MTTKKDRRGAIPAGIAMTRRRPARGRSQMGSSARQCFGESADISTGCPRSGSPTTPRRSRLQTLPACRRGPCPPPLASLEKEAPMRTSSLRPERTQAPTGRRRLRRQEGLEQTRPNALRDRRNIQRPQPQKRSRPKLQDEEARHLLPPVRSRELGDNEEKVLRGPHWGAQQGVRAPLNLQATATLQWADPFPLVPRS